MYSYLLYIYIIYIYIYIIYIFGNIFDRKEIMQVTVECKLVLEVFSFHMFSSWIKLQVVHINIQGFGIKGGQFSLLKN